MTADHLAVDLLEALYRHLNPRQTRRLVEEYQAAMFVERVLADPEEWYDVSGLNV